jgi:hypothetical protein
VVLGRSQRNRHVLPSGTLSRTRVRHFVSLLPAFRFNPVLSFPLTKWKQVQIWRALCLKSNHHSTRVLDRQGNRNNKWRYYNDT